nr:MAG TPA: hypothetical protein [Caudoviricetes sp.]
MFPIVFSSFVPSLLLNFSFSLCFFLNISSIVT